MEAPDADAASTLDTKASTDNDKVADDADGKKEKKKKSKKEKKKKSKKSKKKKKDKKKDKKQKSGEKPTSGEPISSSYSSIISNDMQEEGLRLRALASMKQKNEWQNRNSIKTNYDSIVGTVCTNLVLFESGKL